MSFFNCNFAMVNELNCLQLHLIHIAQSRKILRFDYN